MTLTEKRRELVQRSSAQRAAIIANAEPLVRAGAVADRLLSHVRRHPVALTVGLGAVVLLGSRRLFDLATRALTLYALFKR